MKRTAVCAAASLVGLAASALNLSDKVDIRFAENYAFSTNRAALIATLPPESKAWFTYSILDAQTAKNRCLCRNRHTEAGQAAQHQHEGQKPCKEAFPCTVLSHFRILRKSIS